MNKIIKRNNIGWGNNKFSDKMFTENNNNWFILYTEDIYDISDDETDEACDLLVKKLEQDSRVIYNGHIDSFIVNQNDIDDVEKEYEIEFKSIIDYIDINFGDWQQDYDKIGKHFNIDEHQAYEIVGKYIEEVIENIVLKINAMSKEQILIITDKKLKELEYGYFSRYIYKKLQEQIRFIEDNYKDIL